MRLALIAALALAGCTTTKTVWIKDGATQQEFEQARAQCAYEVSAATQTTDLSYRTVIGQELDRAVRQRDLAVLCMRARGFHEQAAPPDVQVQMRDDCHRVAPDEIRCGK